MYVYFKLTYIKATLAFLFLLINFRMHNIYHSQYALLKFVGSNFLCKNWSIFTTIYERILSHCEFFFILVKHASDHLDLKKNSYKHLQL